tara:strand:- start:2552 stop:2968 length:417 start_codon:yes stop_codon:yes gene_type:complete
MKKVLVFLSLILILFFGCAEDTGTPIWRVWYAVEVTPNYDLDIRYFSDKYHDTKILETINIQDSSYVQQLDGFWVGQHFQSDKETGYFIDVDIKGINQYNGRLSVFVYANDTSLLDSISYPFGTTNITLQGNIPKTFK